MWLLPAVRTKLREAAVRDQQLGVVTRRRETAPTANGSDRPIVLKVRQAKPGGVGSHVKDNTTENF
jgi:hypothetical protein